MKFFISVDPNTKQITIQKLSADATVQAIAEQFVFVGSNLSSAMAALTDSLYRG